MAGRQGSARQVAHDEREGGADPGDVPEGALGGKLQALLETEEDQRDHRQLGQGGGEAADPWAEALRHRRDRDDESGRHDNLPDEQRHARSTRTKTRPGSECTSSATLDTGAVNSASWRRGARSTIRGGATTGTCA